MKKLLPLIICLLAFQQLLAQKYEFSAQVNSGLFNFSSTYQVTNAYFISASGIYRAYGDKPIMSYGAGLQFQWVSEQNFIMGLQTEYQDLRSKFDLHVYIDEPVNIPLSFQTVNGYVIHSNQVLSIAPYLGYRILAKKITFDADAGIFTSIGIHQQDTPHMDGNGNDIRVIDPQYKRQSDAGIRFEIKAAYSRFGLSTGYDYGMSNYYSNNQNNEAYSRMFRFGISYRIL